MGTLRICFGRFLTGGVVTSRYAAGQNQWKQTHRSGGNLSEHRTWIWWNLGVIRVATSHLIPFESPPSCSVVTIPQKDMFKTSSTCPVVVPRLTYWLHCPLQLLEVLLRWSASVSFSGNAQKYYDNHYFNFTQHTNAVLLSESPVFDLFVHRDRLSAWSFFARCSGVPAKKVVRSFKYKNVWV